MIYDYMCNSCGHTQEEIHGMLEKPIINCLMCGFSCSKLISTGTQIAGVDGTATMYNFVDRDTTGKPIAFHSKRQWRQHLKSRGLTDDIPQSVPKRENLKLMRSEKSKETKREEYKKAVATALKEKGILQKYGK
jgi:putative FmdB family regulatory protein